MILQIHNWAEILSAFICTICLLYKPSLFNRWFVAFLWITCFIELTGKMTTAHREAKTLMYNIFNGVEFIFYITFLRHVCERKLSKGVLILTNLIFILCFLINLIFIQGFYTYNNQTHTVGSIAVIIACLILCYEISASDSNHFNLIKWPLICVIAGLILFYSTNILNTSLLNYMVKNDPAKAVRLYKLINHSSNVLLYCLFGLAFIIDALRKPKYYSLNST
jgi:hypothetical protein